MQRRRLRFVPSACSVGLLCVRLAGAIEPCEKTAPVAAPTSTAREASAAPAPASALLSPQAKPPVPQAPPRPALRLPAFLALGIGSLSAGGAVVTGIVGSERQYDPKVDCGAHCGHRPTDQALALATKVLSGVAAVGVSAGLVLLLTSPRSERPSFTPSLGLNLSASKATAKAVWRF